MSMYGDILNKIDDSPFMKIEPGRPAHIRLLGHPWISQQEFTDKSSGEVSLSTRFTWPVWDYSQQRVRTLTQGKSVFKQIAEATDSWPDGETMPSPFDLIIKRTGTGPYDTEYSVSAIPYSGTVPAIAPNQLPDMAKLTNGIPIQQVLEGKPVPVVGSGRQNANLPEPKRPTHTDVINEDQPISEDTVITDLDNNKSVDLSDIPF